MRKNAKINQDAIPRSYIAVVLGVVEITKKRKCGMVFVTTVWLKRLKTKMDAGEYPPKMSKFQEPGEDKLNKTFSIR